MYDLLEHLYFDKHINKYIKKNYIHLFKYISPNTITIIGFIFNIISIYTFFILENKYITGFLLIMRILCDNLDGMVARYYNKVTKLGGVLDAFADFFMIGSITFAIFYCLKIYFYINLIISFCIGLSGFIYLIINDALFVHSNLTLNSNATYIDIIPFWFYNNTYLSTFIVVIFMFIYC